MRTSRRRVAKAITLLLFIAIAAPTLYEHARLNQISVDTARWFRDSDISVIDLGLRLEYGGPVNPGPLSAYAADADCETSPRLSMRKGVTQMANGDLDVAARCFTASLASAPDALDALVLAVSAYHLTGQQASSRAAFEKLPVAAQGTASTAALAIFDYLPATTPSIQEAPSASQLGEIVPRRVLFDLMRNKPDIARAFLERASQAGVFSATDQSDYASLESWLARKPQGRTVSQPYARSTTDDQQIIYALRRSVSESLSCAEDSLEFGPNLLPEGVFEQSHDLNAWHSLSWTTGGGDYNLGEFISGLDTPDGGDGVGALRISGLWKNDGANRFPASGSLELAKPLHMLVGKNLYLMLVRYKTENVRSGQTDLWFDSADYRRFVGVWQLPPSDGAWQELYALGYVDGDRTPVVHPMILDSALGTTWIDYLQVMPVSFKQCEFGDRAMLFGKIPNQDT